VDQFQIGGGYNSFPASWQGHIGSGLTVSSLPDTQAASGALAKPRYVALDSTGNLFITDTGTGNISNVMEYIGPTIPILAAPSLIYYWAGTIANLDSTQGSNSIGQITASSPQTVIVAASFENQIEFYAPANGSLDGISLTSDNNTLAQPVSFSNPQGVAYSSATTYLYIADTNNNRIVFINASTSAYVNSFGPGFGLNGPTGLKVDNANPPNIYVADSGNHRVVVFSP
jgi:DNA-binding beta-propeller fold protein YncE